MIIDEIKNIRSRKDELRKFGFLFGIIFGLIGLVFLWRGRDYYVYSLVISAVFIFFGLVFPVLLKPVHKLWMILAVLLGWLMTRVVLIVLYYLVFTPISVISKMFGKQFLDLKMDGSKKSYWNYREIKEPEKSGYEKQF